MFRFIPLLNQVRFYVSNKNHASTNLISKKMKLTYINILLLAILMLSSCSSKKTKVQEKNIAIVLHGGAGNILPEYFNDSLCKLYKTKLSEALDIGYAILNEGGSSLDAITQTIIYLENCPLFNAGKGAVFTNSGINELDASIMDGRDLNAGAVAGVKSIKNPILAAREVMTNSKHVFLSGEGAEEFAKQQNLEIVDKAYFKTEKAWKALQNAISKEKHGTVGCVALDQNGNLAAGTSTGGMTNKKFGRIGDAPIIGAGTYANNNSCAISATGHGEYFIRYTVAHDISALMQYKNLSLKEASNAVIQEKLVKAEGSGGIIGVDKYGNVVMDFNTSGMFRAFKQSNGTYGVYLFGKDSEN